MINRLRKIVSHELNRHITSLGITIRGEQIEKIISVELVDVNQYLITLNSSLLAPLKSYAIHRVIINSDGFYHTVYNTTLESNLLYTALKGI